MRKEKLIFFGILFVSCFLSGQFLYSQATPRPLPLYFNIFDSVGDPVRFANVKISLKRSNLVLFYQNLGDTNYAAISINIGFYDTIIVTVNASGFYHESKEVYDTVEKVDLINLSYYLIRAHSTLPEAVVTAPPVWIRGDTTFYKVEAFKLGDERKLKDVITKLPGFEIDQNGRLLFQRKIVDRITIEGEDVFGDKLELMLNSFPVHVIDEVQAIENQTSNRLLKGLNNEQLVFVNLGLKKEKLKAAFGDGEVGIGTVGRYLFSPVLFGLYSKIKVGFIANYNSLGTGFDWRYEDEMKLQPHKEAERWIMQGQGIYTINNFESRRYIKNRLFDNRLQVNTPISKKVSIVTELNWVTDRQKQTTQLQSAMYSAGEFVARIDSNQYMNRPDIHNHSIKLDWKIDSAKQLVTGINYYANFSKINQQTLFLFQDGKKDSTDEQIEHQFSGLWVFAEYTQRVNRNKALFIKGNYYVQDFDQWGEGFSGSYPSIFNIAQPYIFLNHKTELQRKGGLFEIKSLSRPRKVLFTNSLELKWEQSAPRNQMVFKDTSGLNGNLAYNALSNAGNFEMYRIAAGTHTSFKMGDFPVGLKGVGGWQVNRFNSYGSISKDNIQHPVLMAELNTRKKLENGRVVAFMVKHEEAPVSLWQTPSYFMPVQIVQFRRFAGADVKRVATSISGTYNFQYGKNSNILLAMFMRQWNGEAYYSELFQFARVIVDSFNKQPFNSLMLNYNGNFNFGVSTWKLNVSAGYNRMGRQYIDEKSILKGRFDFYYLQTNLNKKWNNRYFIEWKANYNAQHNKLPDTFGDSFSPSIFNFDTHLKQRFVLKPWMSVSLLADYYLNNISTTNQASFFLLDTELSINVPKKPFSFRLRFENITNESFFYNVNQGPLNQSFFIVPLVSRNLFAFFRYEL